jgi:glycerophosphoryl diester phosphodiesterase
MSEIQNPKQKNRFEPVWNLLRYVLIGVVSILWAINVSGADPRGCNPSFSNKAALPRKPYVIGHRGGAGLAPENTLAAFKRALEIGVDGVELDVLMSADSILVVHHNYRLKLDITRTPDGKWLERYPAPAIRDLTLAELKRYDVGRIKPGTTYSGRYPKQQPKEGERIPTLSEVFALLKESASEKTKILIEIKTSPKKPDLTPTPEAVADAVVAAVRKENASARTWILSFDWRNLVYVQKIAPEIPTVYLSSATGRFDTMQKGRPGPSPWTAGFDIDDFNGSIPRAIKAAGGCYWAPRHSQITGNLVEEAHGLGLTVFVWTPDLEFEMIQMIKMGVDGIVTNRPDVLNAVLR